MEKNWELIQEQMIGLEDMIKGDLFRVITKQEIRVILSLLPKVKRLNSFEDKEDILWEDEPEGFRELQRSDKMTSINIGNQVGIYKYSRTLVILKDIDDYFYVFNVVYKFKEYDNFDFVFHNTEPAKCDQLRGLREYLTSAFFQESFINYY